MTRQKSLKSRVRTRMEKTGESYTTARRHVVGTSERDAGSAAMDAAVIREQRFSDDVIRDRTGRGWSEWFALLDEWGGVTHTHTEIARWLVEERDVHGWWAQSITVAYEQARGLRQPGQRRGGLFEATASKTVQVPVERAFAAFADADLRARWLPDVEVTVRTATSPKSFRADWEGGTRIVVGFTSKGDQKAQVGLAHEKLPDAEAAARMKTYWRDRLTALKQLLEA